MGHCLVYKAGLSSQKGKIDPIQTNVLQQVDPGIYVIVRQGCDGWESLLGIGLLVIRNLARKR